MHLGDLGSAVAPPVRSGAYPQPKSILIHCSLKIWHLVATILTMLLRISWPNCLKWFLKMHNLCNIRR